MDMVNGTTMNNIISNDILNLKLYINEITDLQLKMHNTNVVGLRKLDEQLRFKILSNNILNSTCKNNLITLLNSFNNDNKLCHGDFHLLNLIKTNNNIVIIDWIDATIGNPEADICRTYMLYLLYKEDIADLYLNDYCKKSNKSKKDIVKWLPIIAGARLYENKENEYEQLLNWINNNKLL
jgi:thiamine kinase-like enzyme